MTFKEALYNGVRCIRLPKWDPQSYVELCPEQGVVKLYDPTAQKAIGAPTPQVFSIMVFSHNDADDYEECRPVPAPR